MCGADISFLPFALVVCSKLNKFCSAQMVLGIEDRIDQDHEFPKMDFKHFLVGFYFSQALHRKMCMQIELEFHKNQIPQFVWSFFEKIYSLGNCFPLLVGERKFHVRWFHLKSKAQFVVNLEFN